MDIEDSIVAPAEVAVPLYRGFEQILEDRPAIDALAPLPDRVRGRGQWVFGIPGWGRPFAPRWHRTSRNE